jgi:hypothetical protein
MKGKRRELASYIAAAVGKKLSEAPDLPIKQSASGNGLLRNLANLVVEKLLEIDDVASSRVVF